MGKFTKSNSIINSGRLSNNNNSKTNEGRRQDLANRFDSRLDARLKLIQKQNQSNVKSRISTKPAAFDARQLLLKKQQKEQIFNIIQSPTIDTTGKSEPLVIVTGLANVRKQGNRIQVIKKVKNDDHLVVSNGINTIVTLKNNIASNNGSVSKTIKNDDIMTDDDYLKKEYIELDRSRIDKPAYDYHPIRIKINNNQAMSSQLNIKQTIRDQDDYPRNSRNFERQLSTNRYKSDYNNVDDGMEESMDYDDEPSSHTQNQDRYSSKSFRSSPINVNNNNIDLLSNSGYKLLVSNLHQKVTEDDILELFSDIGPIKRARFLDKGIAEVVYVKLEHAREAIGKYDKNELDGRPMKIELVQNKSQNKYNDQSSYERSPPSRSNVLSQSNKTVSHTPTTITINQRTTSAASNIKNINLNSSRGSASASYGAVEEQTTAKDSLSNRFKQANANKETTVFSLPDSKKNESSILSKQKVAVDTSIIQQVLFNKKQNVNPNPVTFTVKL